MKINVFFTSSLEQHGTDLATTEGGSRLPEGQCWDTDRCLEDLSV